MERAIEGFHQDESGDWVAELSCLHSQHVRHRPPFRVAPWVLDAGQRADRLGTPLDCPLCDRAELPEGLIVVRTTPVWDQDTVPEALRRAHRVGAGTWGRMVVERGSLRFRAATEPPLDVIVVPGSPQPIPPELDHHVELLGEVRCYVEFLRP